MLRVWRIRLTPCAQCGLVPEDRKLQGAVLSMPIEVNMTMSNWTAYRSSHPAARQGKSLAQNCARAAHQTSVQTDQSGFQPLRRQPAKVVLAKWINADCDAADLRRTDAGVDVGAKAEIYSIIHKLAQEGRAILVISPNWWN